MSEDKFYERLHELADVSIKIEMDEIEKELEEMDQTDKAIFSLMTLLEEMDTQLMGFQIYIPFDEQPTDREGLKIVNRESAVNFDLRWERPMDIVTYVMEEE